MRGKLTVALPVLLGLFALALLYGQLLLPGRALAERDIPALHLPMLVDLARATADGVPYWNPWIHGGQPLLTNPHYSAFYPPTWLIFMMPVDRAIGLLVALHALWAFIGGLRLARTLGCNGPAAGLAALAFVGGGAFVSSPNLFNLFMGLAWFPWVLSWGYQALAASTRTEALGSMARTALGVGAQVLVGSPIMPLLSLLALACLSLEPRPGLWRRVGRLVPIGLGALLLAAIQMLPTLRHMAASVRGSGLDLGTATAWSTPPARLAELVWPRIFGDPRLAESLLYFGYPGVERPVPLILYIYCGMLVFALAMGGLLDRRLPHRRPLIAMLLLGLFLSLGRYNPLYTLVLVQVPPFSVIRFPEKFLLLSTTALVLLATLFWHRILAAEPEDRGRLLRVPMAVAATALLLSAMLYVTPIVAPELALHLIEGTSAEKLQWYDKPVEGAALPADVLAARAGYLGRETFVAAVFWLGSLLLLRLHRRRGVSTGILVGLVLGLLTVEFAYYSRTVNNTVPTHFLRQPPRTLAQLPPETGRVFSDAGLFQNWEFFIPSPDEEIPPALQRFLLRLDPYSANVWGYAYALETDPDMMINRWGHHALETLRRDSGLLTAGWSERIYRFLGAWNVGIIVRRRSPEAQMEEKERTGAMPDPARLLLNPYVLDRYRFVSEVAFEPEIAGAVEQVSGRDFALADFDAVVAAAPGTATGSRRFDPRARLISVAERASRLDLEFEAATQAFLVLAVTADRDWSARLDGEPVPIRVTALGQMGVELPPGRHRLQLRHRNPVFPWGALVSTLTLVGCALPLLPRSRRHAV